MSTYWYMSCEECLEVLHVGQGTGEPWLYTGDKGVMEKLGKFLSKHAGHRLRYASEHDVKEPEMGYKEYKDEV